MTPAEAPETTDGQPEIKMYVDWSDMDCSLLSKSPLPFHHLTFDKEEVIWGSFNAVRSMK